MWSAFQTVFGQMMIILCLLLIGYVFNRKGWAPRETESVLSRLITRIFLPALSFNTFLTRCTVKNLSENWSLLLYGGLLCLISIAVSYPIAKVLARGDRYLAGVLRYSISFPNTGGVAIPLTLAIYGTMGLFQFSLFTLVNVIFCYSWGLAQFMPDMQEATFRQKLAKVCNPNCVAMLIGGIMGLTGLGEVLPQVFYDGVGKLVDCYTATALLLTGFVIADYPLRRIFGDKLVYVMTALRLVVLPLVSLAVMKLLGASEVMMAMACLLLCSPCGMNVVIFPAAYGQSSRFGASFVLISSALSVVTVPLLFALFCG